ncbi:hypothetical protein [Terriglobus aquaticus]|uniref:Uncharacterized protein n=1 Tax=Terriglobus aquaticus TaxID=940139 RepID=A0ABW9KJD0_9BACT|nr:hypothetical protein [Terriglobus aquaticus]
MAEHFGLARPASAGALLLASLVCVPAMRAQVDARPPAGSLPHPDASEENDPFRNNPELRERLQKGRATERQRRIVDDANRLVVLTAQYRTALAAHGTATADDQKLLIQIEKLAREVKDRMRGM